MTSLSWMETLRPPLPSLFCFVSTLMILLSSPLLSSPPFYDHAPGQRGSPASQVWGQQARWSQEAGGRKWEISWNVRFSPQWCNNSVRQHSSCFCPLSVCTVAPCSKIGGTGRRGPSRLGSSIIAGTLVKGFPKCNYVIRKGKLEDWAVLSVGMPYAIFHSLSNTAAWR